jgi:hypothetical protein
LLEECCEKILFKDPKGRKLRNQKRQREYERKRGTKESSCGFKHHHGKGHLNFNTEEPCCKRISTLKHIYFTDKMF